MLAFATYTATGSALPAALSDPITWTQRTGNYNYLDPFGQYLLNLPSSSITTHRVSLNMPGVLTPATPNILVNQISILSASGADEYVVGEAQGIIVLEYGTSYATSDAVNLSQTTLISSDIVTAGPPNGPGQLIQWGVDVENIAVGDLVAALTLVSWTDPT